MIGVSQNTPSLTSGAMSSRDALLVVGHHQANRRDMQTGRVVSVGMADFHDDQVVPFEIDHISLEFFGDHEAIRDLAWKQRVPELPEDVR